MSACGVAHCATMCCDVLNLRVALFCGVLFVVCCLLFVAVLFFVLFFSVLRCTVVLLYIYLLCGCWLLLLSILSAVNTQVLTCTLDPYIFTIGSALTCELVIFDAESLSTKQL